MVQCRQCGKEFAADELGAHLISAHGLSRNPRGTPMKRELLGMIDALSRRLSDFIAETEAELAALDSRLEDLEEPDV